MATKSTAGRMLWLLRHAKTVTDPPPGGADFDRVLTPRGRRDAAALGHLFAGAGEGSSCSRNTRSIAATGTAKNVPARPNSSLPSRIEMMM